MQAVHDSGTAGDDSIDSLAQIDLLVAIAGTCSSQMYTTAQNPETHSVIQWQDFEEHEHSGKGFFKITTFVLSIQQDIVIL